MAELSDVKEYLRVDGNDDDAVITSLISTAKRLVMDVGRIPNDTELLKNKDVADTAIKFAVSYLYENRNSADMHYLNNMLRNILFAVREGVI